MSLTDEQQLKLKFAEAWLKSPNNAYAAALKVTKNDPFLATRICDNYLFDEEVEQFKQLLIDEYGEEHFLPSKCQTLHEIYHRASSTFADDSYVKLMKLAADMRGFIEKPGLTINNNTQTNNRVMLVPVGKMTDQGTVDVDGWEQSAIEQQQALIQ